MLLCASPGFASGGKPSGLESFCGGNADCGTPSVWAIIASGMPLRRIVATVWPKSDGIGPAGWLLVEKPIEPSAGGTKPGAGGDGGPNCGAPGNGAPAT
jgi:hypothetical protein